MECSIPSIPRCRTTIPLSIRHDGRRPPPAPEQPKPQLGIQRFLLSGHGQTLVATGLHQDIYGGNTALLGFDLKTEGALRFGPVTVEDPTWTFHGAPLCDDNWCWVALRHRDVTAQDYVVCFDIRNGREVWRTRICTAETIGHDEVSEATYLMLTLHEDTIYFSTDLGAIASLSASDGQINWIVKYPRTGPQRANLLDEPWFALRDLTPCVYYDGMVIAAPAGCRRIFALDAASGNLCWQTTAAHDATQLLGVGAGNHLIVSGRRLWWIDVYTGRLSQRAQVNPFPAGEFVEPIGCGRGLLAGGNVYWPTSNHEIHVLSQRTGRPTRQPFRLQAAGAESGNLLSTETHMLVATPDTLYVFPRELDQQQKK